METIDFHHANSETLLGCVHNFKKSESGILVPTVSKDPHEVLLRSSEEIAKAQRIAVDFNRANIARARPLKRAIFRFFKKIMRREVQKLRRNGTLRLFSNRAGLKKFSKSVVIEKAFNSADWEELAKLVKTYGVRTMRQAEKKTTRRYGGVWEDPRDPEQTEVWETRAQQEAAFMDEKMKNLFKTGNSLSMQVEDEIRQVLIESGQITPRLGIGDITRNIYTRTLDKGGLNPARAERIARTELASYENRGIHEGYKQSGIEKIQWISIIDGRTRSDQRANHIAMNMRITPVGIPFSNGLMYPGDPSANAPAEIVNCRCTTSPYRPPRRDR